VELLADIRKLWRPFYLWTTLGIVLLSLLLATVSQQTASGTLSGSREILAWLQSRPPADQVHLAPGLEYDLWLEENLESQEDYVQQVEKDAGLAGASQSPLGALGLAVAFMCSMPGVFAILLVASMHVGGEWSGRTVKEVLVADGSRFRFVWVKSVVVFLFGLWLLVCIWIGLILWGLVSKAVFPINTPASAETTLDWLLPMLWRSPLVLALFVVLGVVLTVAVRHPIPSLLAGVLVVFVVNIVVRFRAIAAASPASWVASLMGFKQEPLLWDGIWASQPERLGATMGAIGVFTLFIVLFGSSLVLMWRRDALA
jgi:hypothetical protein